VPTGDRSLPAGYHHISGARRPERPASEPPRRRVPRRRRLRRRTRCLAAELEHSRPVRHRPGRYRPWLPGRRRDQRETPPPRHSKRPWPSATVMDHNRLLMRNGSPNRSNGAGPAAWFSRGRVRRVRGGVGWLTGMVRDPFRCVVRAASVSWVVVVPTSSVSQGTYVWLTSSVRIQPWVGSPVPSRTATGV